MPLETTSVFANVIQEHLELRRRNSTLEHEMPLQKYMPDDPFENHPLFKTEEQARIEDTMDGNQSIVDEPTSLEWPSAETVFIEPPAPAPAPPAPAAPAPPEDPSSEAEPAPAPVPAPAEEESVEASDESLWSRSRDFDWGD